MAPEFFDTHIATTKDVFVGAAGIGIGTGIAIKNMPGVLEKVVQGVRRPSFEIYNCIPEICGTYRKVVIDAIRRITFCHIDFIDSAGNQGPIGDGKPCTPDCDCIICIGSNYQSIGINKRKES